MKQEENAIKKQIFNAKTSLGNKTEKSISVSKVKLKKFSKRKAKSKESKE